jgi:hypothetical protein
MPDQLVIDEHHKLKEISGNVSPVQPPFIRAMANIFSYFFHPLFIPVYITLFLLGVHPYVFSGLDDWSRLGNLLQIFVNCTFLPLVSILLLKGLKFIDSVFLKTQKERIVPYMICMIFYFWNWYAFKNNHGVIELTSLSLAIFIASVLGYLANIIFKVSMHTIAAGVMSTFICLLALQDSANLSLYMAITIILTGIICTSRLIVSDHHPREVYAGLIIGIISQLAAHYFVY